MNTTTTINISKRLITIDTNALQRLQEYLKALNNHYLLQDSGEEIYNDIENRISEIMQQQQKNGKFSIQDEDVKQIINTIGDLKTLGIAEPIVNENTDTNSSENKTNTTFHNNPKKWTRNGKDSIISGFCSGIANYINVDPIWVRLVFLFGILPGGIGLLVYILGSIFVPKSFDSVFNSKRLFRNTDSKVIAGVCSGIAAYFHTNPMYIRLLFVSPIIFGIISNGVFDNGLRPEGFLFNIPFYAIYILLIILLPKASTSSEKLQMKGQQVNANSIQNQVRGNTEQPPIRHSGLGNVIGVFAKIVMYCMVGFILFLIVMISFGLFGGGVVVMQFSDYLFNAGHQQMLANFGWILTCGVPVAIVVLLLIKKFNIYFSLPKHTFSYLGLAWIFGIFCLIALAKDLQNDFSKYQQTENAIQSFTAYNGNSLRIQLPEETDLNKNNNRSNRRFSSNNIRNSDDSLVIGNVRITIKKSVDNFYGYSINNYTRGSSDADMQARLKKIKFIPILQDSTLILPRGIVIKKGDLWRGQKVNLTIFVPEGKYILVDDAIDDCYADVVINTNLPNFNINTTNSFEYATNVWYHIKNGEMYSANSAKIAAEEMIENAKESVDKASEELKDNLADLKDEVKEKLDEAKEELSTIKTEDNSAINNLNKKIIQSSISLLQQNLDSINMQIGTNSNNALNQAKQKLQKAKIALDSLQKTK
jgi:phage shock protein PspC (stress-responsive transcriptional regulator)